MSMPKFRFVLFALSVRATGPLSTSVRKQLEHADIFVPRADLQVAHESGRNSRRVVKNYWNWGKIVIHTLAPEGRATGVER